MFEGDLPADVEEAYERMIRGGRGGLAVRRLAQKPLHVRLAGDEPDLADEYVLQLDCVLAGDGQRRGRRTGAHGIEVDAPTAVRAGSRLFRLAGEADCDLLAG